MLKNISRRERTDMALLRKYRTTGDLVAREQLTRRLTPLVRSLARKYQGRGEDFDDVVQAGMVGLVKAIERFDLRSEHRFVSYAAPNITGEIRRHFRDHTWAVHVPRALQELDAKVQTTIRETLSATGREPTDEALARELGVATAAIQEAKTAGRSYRAMSLEAPAGEERTWADTHGSMERGYTDVENESFLDSALETLSERDRAVLDMRFNDECLQREIAEKIGVSQMQVSRIISAAIVKLVAYADPTPATA